MNQSIHQPVRHPYPESHADPWVDLTRGYVTAVVEALLAQGVDVFRSWLDPCDPRDATIEIGDGGTRRALALVWDEETGWRYGTFVAGHQGVRTVLDEVSYLGGGVLPEPAKVALRFRAGHAEAPRHYRSHADLCDDLDRHLQRYASDRSPVG